MGAYASPEDAYWTFFDRFTAKDAPGWAACMSYPHVRVSPPPRDVSCDGRQTLIDRPAIASRKRPGELHPS